MSGIEVFIVINIDIVKDNENVSEKPHNIQKHRNNAICSSIGFQGFGHH